MLEHTWLSGRSILYLHIVTPLGFPYSSHLTDLQVHRTTRAIPKAQFDQVDPLIGEADAVTIVGSEIESRLYRVSHSIHSDT